MRIFARYLYQPRSGACAGIGKVALAAILGSLIEVTSISAADAPAETYVPELRSRIRHR
jgi:hypothetical protein